MIYLSFAFIISVVAVLFAYYRGFKLGYKACQKDFHDKEIEDAITEQILSEIAGGSC